MHPIEHIRRNVFGVKQTEFAAIAGVTQATVSRWESREFEPTRLELDRIRVEAVARGLAWDDSWFFAVPEEARAAS
jgi:DNA-binding transcriptional regulator YiaG